MPITVRQRFRRHLRRSLASAVRSFGEVAPQPTQVRDSLRRWRADLLALSVLALVLLAVLAHVATTPIPPLTFSLADPPARVALRGFYGLEQNSGGTYRWAKPEATIVLPVTTPLDYAITLTLQDAPTVPSARPVTIAVAGTPLIVVALDGVAREYTVRYQTDPAAWATHRWTAVPVELHTTPFTPVGDRRVLGVIVSRVTLTSLPLTFHTWLRLALPTLLFLASAYVVCRLTGYSRPRTTTLLLIGIGGYALLAGLDRVAVLWWTCAVVFVAPNFVASLLGLALIPLTRTFLCPRWIVTWRSTILAMAEPRVRSRTERRGWFSQASWWVLPPVLFGTVLRVYHADRLSLWLDEGATIYFARLPWARVLGLRGYYDNHPPFYYALVKLVSLVVSERYAGRFLSIALGSLTIVVIAILAAMLIGRHAAPIAGLVLAVSPLHLWYSQEARMYAPCVFVLAVSYLMLAGFVQATESGTMRLWWAVGHGVANLLALYLSYSAAYAILPQGIVLGYLVWRQRRAALPILIATLGTALGYLPWLPQLLRNIQFLQGANTRQGFVVTPARVADSLLALTGVGGTVSASAGHPTPWDHWPNWRLVFLLAFLGVVILGIGALACRPVLAPLMIGALLIGVLATTILLSLVSPGYADRTILAAVLGWVLFVAALSSFRRSLVLRTAGLAGLAFVVVISGVALELSDRGSAKQDFRSLAAEIVHRPDLPIVVLDPVTETLITIYQPTIPSNRFIRLPTTSMASWPPGELAWPTSTQALTRQIIARDALWFEYNRYDSVETDIRAIEQQLRALGYERVEHHYYGYPVFLDLYTRVGTPRSAIHRPLGGTAHTLRSSGLGCAGAVFVLQDVADHPQA